MNKLNQLNKRVLQCLAAAGLLMLAAAASAVPTLYTGILTGLNESPANTSPGVGAAAVSFDDTAHVLVVNVAFAGLQGLTTASHIHCCTASPGTGIASVATETPTFDGFPLNVPAGVYSQSFNTLLASSWNPAFISSHGGTVAGAEAAFNAGLMSGEAYLNIHTTAHPGGEIRGFLAAVLPAAPVPEPANIAMLGLGLPLVLGLAARRRKVSGQALRA